MNEIVAEGLAQALIDLPFLSRVCGCVTRVKKIITSDNVKTFPATKVLHKSVVGGTSECVVTGDYYEMIPDDNEIGMLYFEDLGANVVDSTSRYNTWKGRLKMVVWLNMKRIGGDNGPGVLIGAVLKAVPSSIDISGRFLGGTIKPSKIDPKSFNPFAYYSYDEARQQYLMYPFDYFSIDLAYVARTSKNCETTVVINPESC